MELRYDGEVAVITGVSSAAIVDDKLFLDSAPADWRRMIDIYPCSACTRCCLKW